jgi:N-acyl-D-aspartate/D-glutamate deacylase
MVTAQPYDIFIRNGAVVDGLGGEPYVANVAIRSGKIVAVGSKLTGSGAEEFDAHG